MKNGKVKQMVINIENSRNINTTNSKIQRTKENTNMSKIINNLLELQLHLRHDLKEIEWPPLIIGRITQTNFTHTNVKIMDEY